VEHFISHKVNHNIAQCTIGSAMSSIQDSPTQILYQTVLLPLGALTQVEAKDRISSLAITSPQIQEIFPLRMFSAEAL